MPWQVSRMRGGTGPIGQNLSEKAYAIGRGRDPSWANSGLEEPVFLLV